MKYIIILGDGMADIPLPELHNKTPLETAHKPYMDYIAANGELGTVKTVPDGFEPGSDVANLSVMGYDPVKYYTGRSSLEAAGMGIHMKPSDTSFRCNLVCLEGAGCYEDSIMSDYSAGEIPTEISSVLITDLQKKLGNDVFTFHPGIAYRHCLMASKGEYEAVFNPPHNITGKCIRDFLPSGRDGKTFTDIQKEAAVILQNHPLNIKAAEQGMKPANSIWIWGTGKPPFLPSYKDMYGINGAVITAVDLIKGIAKCADMKVYEVQNATGTKHTDYAGKAEAAITALTRGADLVYLHIEAPDECGHQGDIAGKIESIEAIDSIIIKRIFSAAEKIGEIRIMCLPDHPTPLSIRTHTNALVPYCILDITNKTDISARNAASGDKTYTEKNASKSQNHFTAGKLLFKHFISKMK